MKNPYLFLVFFLTVSNLLSAQSRLYLHKNLEKAYINGTRSLDGMPGHNYWQNHSDYNIQVALNPKKKLITGKEQITYFNNSPDSLKYIRFKLAHDMYRKGGLRAEDVLASDITDGVMMSDVKINNIPLAADKQSRHDTYYDLTLSSPLPPKTSVQISLAWSHTMPAAPDATRECVCDATSFFVSYFYPQIAVYDDTHGWARAPYNGLQEFYHDFANYDVTITLPKGYMAYATGELQNAAVLLRPEIYEKWNKAHQAEDIIPIFSEAELRAGTVFNKAKKNVFHFIAKDVPDFTFATSDHYNWDATSVQVDDKTGRRTFVSAVYNTKSKDFVQVARIAADGIRLMSTWLPGYPFPYPCETIFNGNDGMEYPMMVNDMSVSEDQVHGLTVHEVAHTYFPFMMGINEQYYGWMDEGWANFLDHHLVDSLKHEVSEAGWYSYGAGTDADVPLMVPSVNTASMSLGLHSYARPQMAYTVLLDLLGYETFTKCLHKYMDNWKGKHPIPYDFFNTFNTVSGQDLNWFWKPWFFEIGDPDLAIKSVAKDDVAANFNVIIEKKGSFPVPVFVLVNYSDGDKQRFHYKADVWKNGENTLKIPCSRGKVVKSVSLGDNKTPDTNAKDNIWPMR
jgi:Peptidase family M1 domain